MGKLAVLPQMALNQIADIAPRLTVAATGNSVQVLPHARRSEGPENSKGAVGTQVAVPLAEGKAFACVLQTKLGVKA